MQIIRLPQDYLRLSLKHVNKKLSFLFCHEMIAISKELFLYDLRIVYMPDSQTGFW